MVLQTLTVSVFKLPREIHYYSLKAFLKKVLTLIHVITENPVSFYLFMEQVNPKIKMLFTKLSICILQFVWLNDIYLFSFQLPEHYGLVWRESAGSYRNFSAVFILPIWSFISLANNLPGAY